MFKDLFQKKRKYATIPSERLERSGVPAEGERPKREIPEGLMSKCNKCGTIQYSKELEKNLKVCPTCGHHLRLNAVERIAMTLDPEGFIEFDSEMYSIDPLKFPGYASKLEQQQLKSGQTDAVITGQGSISGYPVIVAVMNFEFFSGSMGSVVGEKITRAIEEATEKQLPLLIFSTSGGARMQESILSLMQMAKTSAALARFNEVGGLYISIITDPTTGGVSASFASLGDIIIAEPGAVFGFAGRIVIEQTIRQKLPDDFQTAEFNLQHGLIDMVVHRKELRATLTKILELHDVKGGDFRLAGELPFEMPLVEMRKKIAELKQFGEEKSIDFTDEVARLEERYRVLEEEVYSNISPSQKMHLARHQGRPTSLDLMGQIFTDFIELHGDRMFGDDLAIVGGIGKLNGVPVTVIGQQRGKDTKENILRFFGSAHPEGFRKALRLMQQADKFKRPIITFVDTKGAYPGNTAEERGQSEAIARNLREMSQFGVPVICVVIGEGGSGGALALAVGNRVLMLEHAIYSAISPNGAASILWKDASKADQAAEAMKITASDLLEMEVVEEIVPEPKGGAHRDYEATAAAIKDALWRHLQELIPLNREELKEDRYRKFRKIGEFAEVQQEQIFLEEEVKSEV